MATLIANSFTSYQLTHQEELAGGILALAQQQLAQNEMSQTAQQILNLRYQPDKPLEFVQEESFLKGQLSIYTLLLQRSDESERALLELARNSAQ